MDCDDGYEKSIESNGDSKCVKEATGVPPMFKYLGVAVAAVVGIMALRVAVLFGI